MTHNEISGIIVDVAIDVHRRLGPGRVQVTAPPVANNRSGPAETS